MDVINNRYRVISPYRHNHMVSSYIVYDMLQDYEIIKLNILNSEYISESLIDTYSKEFITYAGITSENIIKDYEFDLIDIIDNKKVTDKQYYYTCKQYNNCIELLKFIQEANDYEVLDIFVQILRAVNFIHLKGFSYGAINPGNIFVNIENGKNTVKLNDIVSVQMEKIDYWGTSSKYIYYLSPETLSEKKQNVLSDIYSLGVLILEIFIGEEISGLQKKFEEILDKRNLKINNNRSEEFFNKFKPIISKMIETNFINRYADIKSIVDDINNVFGSNFSAFNIPEIEKLSFDTKICGRDYEISKAVRTYELVKNKESDGKIVLVHGDAGVGKTRYLRELRHIFRIKKVNLFYSFSLDTSSNNSSKAITEILKKMISESAPALIKKYESELSVFIPELINSNASTITEIITGEKGKFRAFNGIFGFINEFANNSPIVFIIDNIQFADDYTIELLEFVFSKHIKNSNIMFIVSYSDSEALVNKRLVEFIHRLNDVNNVMEITLRELSVQDTSEMVRCILGARNIYKNFSARIYSLTYGNPLFIQEVIKNLYTKKIIFIDPGCGVWDSNYNEDYSKLPLPSSMEQAVLNQIKEIDEAYYLILKAVSIFNMGVSLEIISEFISREINVVESDVLDLINRGLLCKKIGDHGFVFDFYNRVLKNLVYNKLDDSEKKVMHKKAAELLEKYYNAGREYNEEIVFHHEKSGNKEKVIQYCIDNADRMGLLNNRNDAVRSLQKAAAMFDSGSIDIRKMRILIQMGDIYSEEGNLTQSIDLYNKAEAIAFIADEKTTRIDCLNKISLAYFNKNDIKNTEYYIRKTEEMLKSFKYLEGYLICMQLYSRLLLKKQDYKKAYELVKTSIDICPEKYTEIKGSLYQILGNVYIETSRIEEALHSYEKCIEYFKKTNYVKGIINGLNNIGVIYADFYQNEKKALEYFLKIKELGERNNYAASQAHTLVNIAEMYYNLWDYELSYHYFKEALKLSIQIEYESNVFYCYNYLSNLSLKLNNYAEAYEYYCLAKKELENYPEHGKEIGVHYQISAELFFELGKIDIAREYINKALEIYENDDSKNELDCKIANELINIVYKKSDNINNNILSIKDIIKKYTSNFKKVDSLFILCIVLIDEGDLHNAAEIFRYAERFSQNSLPGVIDLKRCYIMGILEHGEVKTKALNTALDISRTFKNMMVSWRVLYTIGNLYYSSKNYFYSINYYFEACEIVRNLVLQVPGEYRLEFVNFNQMLKPYNKLYEFRIRGQYRNNAEMELKADSNKDIDRIIDYQNFVDILQNKLFIKSAKKMYRNALPENIRDIKDIVANLSSNAVKNLELLAKYISSITLASNVLVLLDSFDKGYYCIASSSGVMDQPANKYIIDMAKALKEPQIISNSGFDKNSKDYGYISNSIKSSMCIPIKTKEDIQKDEYIKDRRRKSADKLNIKGYLYLESDRILNNFNEESMDKCLELTGLIGLMIDKYQLKISSTIDKLTGTVTRKALEDIIIGLIEDYSKSGGCFSILMFDLDHFKNINDRFGHQTGDTALKRVCEVVLKNIRAEDTCGRYGGEEFIIVLPDVKSEETYNIAEKIRIKVEDDKVLGDKYPVTISLGISAYPQHGQWKQDLIEKADQALYVAKELGRNKSQIWSSEFSSYKKGTNKLTGIISGNAVQDSRNVLVMSELIELIKCKTSMENKIFNALGRIIEITEAQNGILFIIKNDKVIKKYGRKIFIEEWADIKSYNIDIISSVILKKQGLYMIDWDEIAGYDLITGNPDWHSIIVVPVIKSGIVKGVLYLTVSTKLKEFNFDDFNYVETLGEIVSAII